VLKAAVQAAFFIYCSSRDEGARIYSVIATPFKVAAVSSRMTAYTKFLYPPKTHYLKTAACERQQPASPEDTDIPHCVDNADESIAVIRDTMRSGIRSVSARHQPDQNSSRGPCLRRDFDTRK
jgi:hypothetical protein